MKRDPFFQRRKDWARYKHSLLDRYLRVWVYKLGTRSPVLAFVDTCAGEGTYDDGKPGSPLIAARWNDTYLRAKGKRMMVVACEERQESADILAGNLATYIANDPPEAVILRRSFVSALPEILDLTRAVPTLIFIDPYGLDDLTAEKLAPLLKDREREPTEVLVRVPPGLLARFAGWLKRKERSEKGEKTASGFRKLLQALHIPDSLLDQFTDTNEENPVGVNDLLAEYLQLFATRFRFVHTIPVRERYDAPIRYLLVHGTDSEHGLAHMNDIVSSMEDQLHEETEQERLGSQMSMFDVAPRQRKAGIADAELRILKVLRESPQAGFMAIRAELALAFGPDLRERDHKRGIRGLVERGLIEIAKDDPKETRRSYRLVRRES